MKKPRNTRISREDVITAADEVLRAGKKPSIERVLAILQRGSPNTVGKYLNAYWANLHSRLHESTRLRSQLIPLIYELHRVFDAALSGAAGEKARKGKP